MYTEIDNRVYMPNSFQTFMNAQGTKNQTFLYLPEGSEDITGTGSVLAAMYAGTKLSDGLEYIDVVWSDKILSQVDDGSHQSVLQTKSAVLSYTVGY